MIEWFILLKMYQKMCPRTRRCARELCKSVGRTHCKKCDVRLSKASLSLQASSKIYEGRVEALYQDTMKFHSHLQSIVSGGRKEKKKNEDEMNDEDEESSDKDKNKARKTKSKTFLKAEEEFVEPNTSSDSRGEPHGNFLVINAAFSTSRLAPKLLSSLQLSNDQSGLRCAVADLCVRPKKSFPNSDVKIPPKLKGILEKIKKFNVSQTDFESARNSNEENQASFLSSPIPAAASPLVDDGAGFDVPDNVSMMASPLHDENDVRSVIEKIDVLNITVDAFLNDITVAMTNEGIDNRLLPPNSVLKKVIDKSNIRSSVKPSMGKTTKKKTKEPFFEGKSANDIKHLFVKGRSTTISQKVLSEWNIENTSNVDLAYEFIEELEKKMENEAEYISPTLNEVLDVIKQNDPQYHFKYYFNKQSQIWKFTRRKLCVEQSLNDTAYGNQTEKRVGSIAPSDPEALAMSFQNLSIHDSIHEAPDSGSNICDDGAPADFMDSDEPQFPFPSEPFDADIEDLLVKPPELVRPAFVKYDQKPVNLNIEKIKDLLWSVISRHIEDKRHATGNEQPFALFSEVYEELSNRLKEEISEFVSMQFMFVVLLILANQKTLLIENVKENTDLSIKQDISEIVASDNT